MNQEVIRNADGRLEISPSAQRVTWEGEPLAVTDLALRVLIELVRAQAAPSMKYLTVTLHAEREQVQQALGLLRTELDGATQGELSISGRELIDRSVELAALVKAARKPSDELLAMFLARIAGSVRGAVAAYVPPGVEAWIAGRGGRVVMLDGPRKVQVRGLVANFADAPERRVVEAVGGKLILPPDAFIVAVLPRGPHEHLERLLRRGWPALKAESGDSARVLWTPGSHDPPAF
jgi:hypothetical protein